MVFLGLDADQWIEVGVSAAIIFGTVILGRWVVHLILDRLVARLVKRTKTELDNILIDSLQPTLYSLAIALAFQFGLARLDFISEPRYIDRIFFVIYTLIAFIFLWRLFSRMFAWYGKEIAPETETELDEQWIPFFSRVSLIILVVIALIIVLGQFDVDISSLVTTLGIGSLAIALAAQATLADTISGFVIMVDRPFRIGDRIEIQDLDTWGDVIDIGLRSSRIRTRDNRMVIVPNSVIGKSLIVNYSYPDTLYRIENHIGVAYGTDLEIARKIIIDTVKEVEGVSPDHPVEALFLEFAESALIFRVRWWLDSFIDTRRMFDKVNTAVYNALNEAGIEIPFPQRELYHKFDADNLREFAETVAK
jgi:small-conductance mechanosensitive channel